MSWSPQQERAIRDVKAWLRAKNGPQVFRLFGYAGTGKTTLAKDLADGINGRVVYGAFTGKAALVLRRKGCDGASTIHSLIYRVDESRGGWEPQFVLNPDSLVGRAKLVVIDEVSMVGEDLARDLLSFGTKVLVLGDPAQLPPVKGSGFFIDAPADVMLTEVHRQARENPIVQMSMDIREGRALDLGEYGTSKVIRRADVDRDEILRADQILVGLNKTRRAYNDRVRELRKLDPTRPVEGDKLICLRNDKDKKLLNGQICELSKMLKADADGYTMQVTSEDYIEDAATEVFVRREFFEGREDGLTFSAKRGTQEFTYGYAITVHKSQGSQWDHVVVFDESRTFREDRDKHLYTAITRAAERVTVVV